MNNTGSHVSKEAIIIYVTLLHEIYNIEIIFQFLCSTYTIVLDLGIQMSLHATADRQYYVQRCNTNDIISTVFQTRKEGILDWSILKVFARLKNVQCNVTEAKNGNDLVETKIDKI